MIGAMQWAITLARFDIAVAVATLSSFRVAPSKVTKEIPRDVPKPQGKPVVLTSYVDANLYHDYVTGRSMTGIHIS